MTMDSTGTHFMIAVDFRSSGQPHDSGYAACADDLESARDELSKAVNYYLRLTRLITHAHIDEVCSYCSGAGAIFVPQKRNKWLGKSKRCPECKGKAEERIETWVDIPDEYRQLLSGDCGEGEAV